MSQRDVQEPVAEVTGNAENHGRVTNELFWHHKEPLPVGTNLYTAAPSQPMTDEDINRSVYEHTKLNPNQAYDVELLAGIRAAIRAIIAALREKEGNG